MQLLFLEWLTVHLELNNFKNKEATKSYDEWLETTMSLEMLQVV